MIHECLKGGAENFATKLIGECLKLKMEKEFGKGKERK